VTYQGNNPSGANYALPMAFINSSSYYNILGSLTFGTFTGTETVNQTGTSGTGTFSMSGLGGLMLTSVTGSPDNNPAHTWIGQSSGAIFTPSSVPTVANVVPKAWSVQEWPKANNLVPAQTSALIQWSAVEAGGPPQADKLSALGNSAPANTLLQAMGTYAQAIHPYTLTIPSASHSSQYIIASGTALNLFALTGTPVTITAQAFTAAGAGVSVQSLSFTAEELCNSTATSIVLKQNHDIGTIINAVSLSNNGSGTCQLMVSTATTFDGDTVVLTIRGTGLLTPASVVATGSPLTNANSLTITPDQGAGVSTLTYGSSPCTSGAKCWYTGLQSSTTWGNHQIGGEYGVAVTSPANALTQYFRLSADCGATKCNVSASPSQGALIIDQIQASWDTANFTVPGSVTSGTFTPGETVTQAGTLVTGVVVGSVPNGGPMIISTYAGGASFNGVWTGGTSNAHFTPSQAPYNEQRIQFHNFTTNTITLTFTPLSPTSSFTPISAPTGTTSAAPLGNYNQAINTVPTIQGPFSGPLFSSGAFNKATALAAVTQNATKLWAFYYGYSTTVNQISQITFSVTTADNTANVYDIGIYGPGCYGGNTGVPLQAHIGATAGSAINAGATGGTQVSLSGGANQVVNLTPGWYCLAITSSAAAPALVLGGDSGATLTPFANGASPGGGTGTTTGGALNATITAPANGYQWTSGSSTAWVFLY
jgi:hypothetical protein